MPLGSSCATEGEGGFELYNTREALSVPNKQRTHGSHPLLVYGRGLSSACLWAPGDRSFDRCRLQTWGR